MKKEALVFIGHIVESIANIEAFMAGVTESEFRTNKEKQSAIVRQIEIIGEAVKNLPSSLRNAYPLVPWKDIAGMRDKLMHHYFSVDLEVVLKVVKKDIPILKQNMIRVKKDLEEKKRAD